MDILNLVYRFRYLDFLILTIFPVLTFFSYSFVAIFVGNLFFYVVVFVLTSSRETGERKREMSCPQKSHWSKGRLFASVKGLVDQLVCPFVFVSGDVHKAYGF